jgi:GT2 family glycosyltransferase
MPSYAPGITAIVPTYKRVADLDRCLAALEKQTLPAAALLLCYREEDTETVAYLARTDRHGLGARLILCDQPGQVYALSKAIDAIETEYLAITDDDSIPQPDWLERMVAHFEADARVAGVGGRDHVFEHGHWLEGAETTVGLVRWHGATVGNHHIGVGPARPVHTLKGVNMGYRRSALGDLRPDARLRGKGAQVGNDMKLSLELVARGYTLIYDPAVLVEHFPGVRPKEEDRAYFNAGSHFDEYFNKTLILLEFMKTQPWGRLRQCAMLLYLGLRGTRKAPGLGMLAVNLATRYPNSWARFRTTFAAYRTAIAAAR